MIFAFVCNYNFSVVALLCFTALSTSVDLECYIDSIPATYQTLNSTLKLCRPPIKALNINDNQLQRLDDVIEQTPDIQNIKIQNVNLTSIEHVHFCKWEHLKKVDLSKNAIKMLPNHRFLDCAMVTEMTFFQNEICEMEANAFVGLYSLKFLDLSMNEITVLAENIFRPLSKLKELRMASNIIQVLDADLFQHNHNIEALYLYANSIDTIQPKTLLPLKKLKVLNVGNNPNMTSIDLPNMNNLCDVYLNGAAIKTLNLPERVGRINASDNSISRVTAAPNTTITVLSLARNQLNALNDLPAMPNLIELYVEKNYFSDINMRYDHQFVDGILEFGKKVPKLQRLKISSDNPNLNNTQFDKAAQMFRKHNISILIDEVSIHVKSLDILFQATETIDSRANESSERPIQIDAPKDNVDERLSSLKSVVFMLAVFSIILTVIILVWFVSRYFSNCMAFIQKHRAARRNLSRQNLNELEESSIL